MKKIYYKSGFKYQLVKDYSAQTDLRPAQDIRTEYIRLHATGCLEIREGYAWDGPSGPTIDTPNFMRGSLVHDAFYQLIRQELLPASYRLAADDELRKICKEDGMSSFRAWYVHLALFRVGGAAADPKNKKQVLEAPK